LGNSGANGAIPYTPPRLIFIRYAALIKIHKSFMLASGFAEVLGLSVFGLIIRTLLPIDKTTPF